MITYMINPSIDLTFFLDSLSNRSKRNVFIVIGKTKERENDLNRSFAKSYETSITTITFMALCFSFSRKKGIQLLFLP